MRNTVISHAVMRRFEEAQSRMESSLSSKAGLAGSMFLQVLVGICFVIVPSVSMANKPSDSYLKIEVDKTFTVQWDIALRDLEILIGLDSNFDGKITWGEVRQQQQKIFDEAVPDLKISIDEVDLPLQPTGLKVTEHSDGAYAVLELTSDAMERFTLMKVDYDFFFDVDQTHRSLVDYGGDFGSGSYVITDVDKTLVIPEGGTHWFYLTLTYIKVGAKRFFTDYDHLAFLIALILPSVWQFEEKRLKYIPVVKGKTAIQAIFWLVICLTFAQWITLSQSVSDSTASQSNWVQTAMAALVALSAIHNMYPMTRYWGVIATIGFGLLLGLGSGEFLKQQGLPSAMVPISLLGFSIGLGLAQLALVAVLFSVAVMIRRTNFYDQFVFHGGSTLIVVLGTMWVIERLTGSTILQL